MLRHCVLLLLLGLTGVAFGEQIIIRNRTFEGRQVRLEGKLWLELGPLAQALGLKILGNDDQGYALGEDGEPALPGAGKVRIKGKDVETSIDSGPLLVNLEEVAGILGAKIIVNEARGSVEVKLPSAVAGPAVSAIDFSLAPYTLIEWNHRGDNSVGDRVHPVFEQAEMEFKNVQFLRCDPGNDGQAKRFAKYKTSRPESYPSAVLMDRTGKKFFELHGGHVIEDNLLKKMRQLIDISRR